MKGADTGYFYAVRLSPDLPGHLKLGFSTNPQSRLRTYRAALPGAEIVSQWECPRWAESEARKAIVGDGQRVGGEVYRVEDLEAFVANAGRLFTEWKSDQFRALKRHVNDPEPSGRPRLMDAIARRKLIRMREKKSVSQHEVAEAGEITRSTVARLEAKEGAGLTLPVFVGYCRGLGEKAWKVLRDVEEEVYGE